MHHDVGDVHIPETKPVPLFVTNEQLPFNLLTQRGNLHRFALPLHHFAGENRRIAKACLAFASQFQVDDALRPESRYPIQQNEHQQRHHHDGANGQTHRRGPDHRLAGRTGLAP